MCARRARQNRWNSALRRELRKLNRLAKKQGGTNAAAVTAATAAAAAAAGCEGPEECEAGAQKKTRSKKRSSAQLTAAALAAARQSESIVLDSRELLPHGVTPQDQLNAKILLDHMHELNRERASGEGRTNDLSANDLSASQMAEHVDWLQSFCTSLVEKSLAQRQQQLAEPEQPRKRRRRSKAAVQAAAPASPPVGDDDGWALGPLAPEVGVSGRSRLGGCEGGALSVHELLQLVSAKRGGLLPTPLPHAQHLASPVAISESDFATKGALSSPHHFLSPRDLPNMPAVSALQTGRSTARHFLSPRSGPQELHSSASQPGTQPRPELSPAARRPPVSAPAALWGHFGGANAGGSTQLALRPAAPPAGAGSDLATRVASEVGTPTEAGPAAAASLCEGSDTTASIACGEIAADECGAGFGARRRPHGLADLQIGAPPQLAVGACMDGSTPQSSACSSAEKAFGDACGEPPSMPASARAAELVALVSPSVFCALGLGSQPPGHSPHHPPSTLGGLGVRTPVC